MTKIILSLTVEGIKKLPPARIELATSALQVQRSTTKLRRLFLFSNFWDFYQEAALALLIDY